ncbi:MAG: hypothetical protein AB6733_15300 [Clostridiaceae bacterium]
MIPFKGSYYENKINDFNNKCLTMRDIEKGNCKLEWKLVQDGRVEAYMHAYNTEFLRIPELFQDNVRLMGVTPLEVGGCFEASRRAHGKVGVVGLGLGYFVQELISKEKAEEIIVYEISKDVIDIYKELFGENEKVKIINCDAFSAEGEEFDFFFADIYKNKLTPKVAEDYSKFNKLHKIKEYSFFGVEQFILSLDEADLEEQKLPINWVAMADLIKEKFEASRYRENFIKIKYDRAKKILEAIE